MTVPASSAAPLLRKASAAAAAMKKKKVAPTFTEVLEMLRCRRVCARRSWPPRNISPVKKPSKLAVSSAQSPSMSFSGEESDSDCESACSSTGSCSHPPNPRPDDDDDTGNSGKNDDVQRWMFVSKSSTSFILVRNPN
ncbi:unnamed protein product [Cuscuta epithymum]|uniref:Ovate family protein n=1 Tax=Cuscuta epithymum TaxID=186058 RepID=A0AAV0CKZ6_9ASTE|nr:unnamed protein product [Cuscuta epithymum]